MRNQLETWNYPSVHDYASALEAWEKGPKFRNHPERAKLVVSHRDKWIEKEDDGKTIAFMRGGCGMVRWHQNDDVTITPYTSTQTHQQFAGAFLPSNMAVAFTGIGAPWVRLDSPTTYWRIPRGGVRMTRVRGAWRPKDATPDWSVPSFSTKLGNAALKRYGYPDFALWATARVALGGWYPIAGIGDPRMTAGMAAVDARTLRGSKAILAALSLPERWEELLLSPNLCGYTSFGNVALERVLEKVRACIYAESHAITVTNVPHLSGTNAVRHWAAAHCKYKLANVAGVE